MMETLFTTLLIWLGDKLGILVIYISYYIGLVIIKIFTFNKFSITPCKFRNGFEKDKNIKVLSANFAIKLGLIFQFLIIFIFLAFQKFWIG